MKKVFFALAAAACAVVSTAQGAKVSVEFFYDSLEPHGEWIEAADYGYVWHPRDVDNDWRPYTEGNWAYTDAGWTWVSEEPFGWATYHYGRWVEINPTGWVWVPDTTWGPAWVSWRRSKTHVGWAPLPPEARFEGRVGFSGWVDSYYDIGPTHYSFVNVRDLGAPRLRTVVLPPRENITIINQTTNITNISYANNVVVNNGPEYDVIVRESAQPIRRLKLERRTEIETDVRTARFRSEVSGGSLRVVAPEIETSSTATAVKPKKVARKLERVTVNRGWREAGDPQRVREVRAKMASETKTPEGLPPKPQLRGSDETATNSRDAAPAAAGTAATESDTKTPRAATPGTTQPGDKKKPGAIARQPDETLPQDPAQAPGAKPGTTAAQKPDSSKPDATAQQPDATQPEPGTQAPGSKPAATATQKPDTSKPAATAQQPDATGEDATAQEKPDRRREDRPGAAKKKASEGELPATSTGPAERPDSARPETPGETPAAGARSRSEAGETERPPQSRPGATPRNRATEEAATARPGAERPQRENRPGAERPERARPETDRPDVPRPEAGRAERPAPQGERPDRPERRGPADAPQRSAERPRPEAANSSPESKPPTAERPDRAPTAEKEGEKKKEKSD